MARTRRQILVCAALGFFAKRKLINMKKRNRRRWWVKPIYQERNAAGFFETTFQTMKKDKEMFFKATRMSVDNFTALLALIKDKIEKYSSRKPILAECRLALTLMFLAHGGSRSSYSLNFKISVPTVSAIINETCEALWNVLNLIYMAPPNLEEWKNISLQYEEKWKLPNCLGAIDGKHVSIVCPPNAGSQFHNYKNRHSIALLAVCDANYCFSMVDIGEFGSQSDGDIFAQSSFGRILKEGKLAIPTPRRLPNTTDDSMFPYYFVGDNAFPLSTNLMRPFPGTNINEDETNFNKRLSHAKVTIENTFRILSARWRVLRKDIHALPNNVDNIIKACVILHNYLMLQNCTLYCPQNYPDSIEDDFVTNNLARSSGHNAPKAALNLRKKLCSYLKHN